MFTVGEAKDTGDRATSNRQAEKTLAGVRVSVRRRWLKGKTQPGVPLADGNQGRRTARAMLAHRLKRSAWLIGLRATGMPGS